MTTNNTNLNTIIALTENTTMTVVESKDVNVKDYDYVVHLSRSTRYEWDQLARALALKHSGTVLTGHRMGVMYEDFASKSFPYGRVVDARDDGTVWHRAAEAIYCVTAEGAPVSPVTGKPICWAPAVENHSSINMREKYGAQYATTYHYLAGLLWDQSIILVIDDADDVLFRAFLDSYQGTSTTRSGMTVAQQIALFAAQRHARTLVAETQAAKLAGIGISRGVRHTEMVAALPAQ